MKRLISLLLCLLLLGSACTALADTLYVHSDEGAGVTLRHEVTNEALTVIPNGTALTPDINRSTDMFAYVTYNGFSGYLLWRYLWRNAPDGTPAQPQETEVPDVPQVTEVPAPQPTEVQTIPVPEAPAEEGFTVQTVGAFVQVADKANQPISDRWTMVRGGPELNLLITADVPAGQNVAAWIINGAFYAFNYEVTVIRMTNLDRDYVIEAVTGAGTASTQPGAEAVQAGRDGHRLLMVTKNAQLCHVDQSGRGAGGWLREFDFTTDYVNRATGAHEAGGRLTARIKATVPRGKYVMGWKFDETRLYPNRWIDEFVVYEQFESITYEPIFGEDAGYDPPNWRPDPTITDPPGTVVWPNDPTVNWNNNPTGTWGN